MPENWKTYKFREIATLQRGFDLPTQNRIAGSVPIIAASGIGGYHNISKVKGPGVITGRSGTIGKVMYQEGDFWPLNTSLWVKNFHGNDKRFVYYLLSNFDFSAFNNGTSVPTLNRNDVHGIDLCIPPQQEQKSIASILSALDDKIELNLQMNKTLEEMAMALYKHWFVDFGPFQDCEFVDSELGEIPKGWVVKKLPEISKNHNKKRKPLSTRERAKRQGIYPYYGATKILDYIDEYKFEGEFILLAEDGTVKTERDTPYLQFVEGKFWVSNHAHVLSGNGKYSNEFLYLCLNNKNVIPIITGAVQLKINKQNSESLEFVVPPKETLKVLRRL